MPGQSGHNTRLHAQLPPSFLDMDTCTTSQLNVVLVRKLLCAWFIFDTLSISVCTTSHRQTSGQLVQELNVCTVVKEVYNDEYIVTGLADKGGVIVVEDVAVNEGFRQVSDLKVYTETLEVLIHEYGNNMKG